MSISESVVVSLLLVSLVLGSVGCAAQPAVINAEQLAHVNAVAILPFEDAPGVDGKNSGTAVSGFITTELIAWAGYKLVERSRLQSIISEKDLQASDFTNPQTVKRIGKLLGVDAVIVGSLSQYDMDKTQVYVYVVPVVTRDYKVGINIRMINVTNGQVIYAHSACGSSTNDFTEAGQKAAKMLLQPVIQAKQLSGKPHTST